MTKTHIFESLAQPCLLWFYFFTQTIVEDLLEKICGFMPTTIRAEVSSACIRKLGGVPSDIVPRVHTLPQIVLHLQSRTLVRITNYTVSLCGWYSFIANHSALLLQCVTFVDKFTPEIIQLLDQEIDPTAICTVRLPLFHFWLCPPSLFSFISGSVLPLSFLALFFCSPFLHF